MGMWKKIAALFAAIVLLFALFVPAWATEEDASESDIDDTEEVATNSDIVDERPQGPQLVIINEQVMDYTKLYPLASIKLGEDCSYVYWYVTTESGEPHNYLSGSMAGHHGDTLIINWSSLDFNGKHPAGAWNKPTTWNFTLWVKAIGTDGKTIVGTWNENFSYTWYDNSCPQSITTTPATSTTGPHSSDVPHTGL